MVSPSAKRQGVKILQEEHGYSERRACSTVGIARSSARYQSCPKADEIELTQTIRATAMKQKRYGYRRVTKLLGREGSPINKKRVHRIWKREGLQVPRRRAKKRRRGPAGEVFKRAERPNHVWSYDFLEDRTEAGAKLRILTVLDEFTRESLAIRVARSSSARDVIDTLEWLFLTRGVPEFIRSDNGPEFIAKAIQTWLGATGCQAIFITPGSPWENPFTESFNGSLRDECLNMELFTGVKDAQAIVEDWRQQYNNYRPHSSLGYKTPSEFAAEYNRSHEAKPTCPGPPPPTSPRRAHSRRRLTSHQEEEILTS